MRGSIPVKNRSAKRMNRTVRIHLRAPRCQAAVMSAQRFASGHHIESNTFVFGQADRPWPTAVPVSARAGSPAGLIGESQKVPAICSDDLTHQPNIVL